MYRISFIDGFCPRSYDARSLMTEPMGGTESTVTLLAESLNRFADIEVEVVQHCRELPSVSANGVLYRGTTNLRAEASTQRSGVTVIINSPKLLKMWRRYNKNATLILWRHNFLGNRHRQIHHLLEEIDAHMVCVSQHHLAHTHNYLQLSTKAPRLHAIANPVQIYVPNDVRRDSDKLLFCSSPHKGLDQCLSLFESVRRFIPSLRLAVCNPGYLPDALIRRSAVDVLGALTRPELHRHMSESLCVFYPQTQFSETFGLVAAESNLLGTPILAPAQTGALSEVVGTQEQLVDTIDLHTLVSLLQRWRSHGPPKFDEMPSFDPNHIAIQWKSFINQRGAQASAPPVDSTKFLTANPRTQTYEQEDNFEAAVKPL